MNEVLKRACKHYGLTHQSMICVEEMSELTKELIKYHRGVNNLDAIAEELADVEIMLEQIRYLYDINLEVDYHRARKIKRLEMRLNDDSCTMP